MFRSARPAVADEAQGWTGYLTQAIKTSSSYLPSQMTEVFTQQRDFAFAKLPFKGTRNVCTLTMYALILTQFYGFFVLTKFIDSFPSCFCSYASFVSVLIDELQKTL